MPKFLPFRKRGSKPPPTELVATVGVERRPVLDVAALAKQLQQYDLQVRERLRRAALRAIDEELVKIQAERKVPTED
jgi:hypothetical protein